VTNRFYPQASAVSLPSGYVKSGHFAKQMRLVHLKVRSSWWMFGGELSRAEDLNIEKKGL